MATFTASFSNNYIRAGIDLNVVQQDIAGNRSLVSASAYAYETSASTAYNLTGKSVWAVSADGYGYVTGAWNYDFRPAGLQTVVVWSAQWWVGHRDDGTQSISIAATLTSSATTMNSATPSGSITLPTIPRASSVSVATGALALDGVTQQTATISRAVGTFTHTVEWIVAGTVMATQTGVATSQVYVPPQAAWLAKLPAATSATATVRVTTYSGGTQIGAPQSTNFTVTVPAVIAPAMGTPGATRTGQTALAAYIAGYSGVSVNFTGGVAGLGATLTGWTIVGPGITASGTGATGTGSATTLDDPGTALYTVTLTDSRGRTVVKTVSITVEGYMPPKIDTWSAARCTSTGVLDATGGTYARVSATITYTTVAGNTATCQVAWKKTGAPSNTGTATFTSGVAATVGGGAITVGDTWQITWTVTDKLGNTASAVAYLSTAVRVIHGWAAKMRLALGRIGTKDNTLQVGLAAEFDKAVSLVDPVTTKLWPVPGARWATVKSLDPLTVLLDGDTTNTTVTTSLGTT